jgi:co-chaperonin GroES (HSP10)
MNTEPASGQLYPLNDCILVELKQSSKNFSVKEGKYDSRTEGIVIAIPKQKTDLTATIIGKRVHFEEFKEGARIKRGGKIYSFIKIEDIRGYENE